MQNPDVRVPAWFAIKRFAITPQTFNYWRSSGKVTPDENGEYRWGDLLEVEQATRNSPNSRRGTKVTRRANWQGIDLNSTGMRPA